MNSPAVSFVLMGDNRIWREPLADPGAREGVDLRSMPFAFCAPECFPSVSLPADPYRQEEDRS